MIDAFKQIEQTCVGLNELKQLELAINERLARFGPTCVEPVTEGLGSSQLSARQQLTVQYDLLRLTTRYREIVLEIASTTPPSGSVNLEKPSLSDLEATLAEVADIEGSTFRASRNIYKRNRNAKGLARFRCEYTDDVDVDQIFTEEEHYGEFFDLHELHHRLIKLRERESDYNSFVQNLPDIAHLLGDPDSQHESDSALMLCLRDYLLGFHQRTHPLSAPVSDSKEYQALTDKTVGCTSSTNELYCDVCKKQYSSKGIFTHHFGGRKHLKAAQEVAGAKQDNSISLLTSQVEYLLAVLGQTARNTAENGIRRQAMTEAEKLSDAQNSRRIILLEDEQESGDENSEDDDAVGYDTSEPQSLTGPDGVPIPRWLYNLHGYSEEFNCEVCANQLFMGRRLFQRHFNEPKHINGLLALGINSNMDAYVGLASLADVQKLKNELSRAQKSQSDSYLEPEMEDSKGNVMTEKIYNDLKKQGLA